MSVRRFVSPGSRVPGANPFIPAPPRQFILEEYTLSSQISRGILPREKSAILEKGLLSLKTKQTGGGFDEVKDIEKGKWDLLHREHTKESAHQAEQTTETKVVLEQGRAKPLSRSRIGIPTLEVLEKDYFWELRKNTTGGLSHLFNWVFDPDFSQYGHSFKEAGRYTLDGWFFPGQGGTPYATCGTIHYKGCLNISHPGRAGVRAIKDNCGRSTCPVCSDQWLMRTTKKIEHRIEAYADELKRQGVRHRKPIHMTANPPPETWDEYKELNNFNKKRKMAQQYAKEAGFRGGCIIYHQKRECCGDCGGKILFKQRKCKDCGAYHIVWYFSPHFHLLGFGYIRDTKQLFEKHGWVLKNHGIRSDVGATAYYQLSHCSIHQGKHTVVWFGKLHYSKFKLTPPEMSESDIAENECPLCGNKLRLMQYYGNKPPPLGKGVEVIDSSGWIYGKTAR